MFRRLLGSAAYRAGPFAEAVIGILPRPKLDRARDTAAFTLVTLCGARQMLMQQESLLSMTRAWDRIPPLVAVSDGSLTAKALGRALDWWPSPVRVKMRTDVAHDARALGQPDVAAWAERALFGLKFAAIVTSAVVVPTLYCDSDILWFRDIRALIDAIERPREPLAFAMTEDYQPAYDSRVAELLSCDVESNLPYRNAGLIYLRGDLLSATDLTRAIREAGTGHFAEQTTFAIGAARLNAPLIPRTDIACHQSDDQTLAVTYRGTDWCARHYVGPVRHLFWRDALAQRLGMRQ